MVTLHNFFFLQIQILIETRVKRTNNMYDLNVANLRTVDKGCMPSIIKTSTQ